MYANLSSLVAESINEDWGDVRHANKKLARLADINESTLKGIRQQKHCPSLLTTFQLVPHAPTLRRRLAEMLGFDVSASSEAKRIQKALQALTGELDDHKDVRGFVYQPASMAGSKRVS